MVVDKEINIESIIAHVFLLLNTLVTAFGEVVDQSSEARIHKLIYRMLVGQSKLDTSPQYHDS